MEWDGLVYQEWGGKFEWKAWFSDNNHPDDKVGVRFIISCRAICPSAASRRTHAGIMGGMIELTIPGRGELRIQHVVTDVNGTLALDGQLPDGLAKRLSALRDRVSLHLITADTHGRQASIDQQLGVTAERLQPGDEPAQKADFVRRLGADTVVAIGQGANDAAMLKEAALGICVMSREGVAVETLLAADIVVPDIFAALELLEKPLRILATLRT